jgi:Sap, sulfolipid-1-addressing protein
VLGSLLALAVLTALNPVRLGITLLVISRPRPVPNLLVYWFGCLTGCVPAVMVPLTLLHLTPMFKSWADGLTKSSTGRHVQLGMGVLVLSIAVLITVRALIRRRQPTDLPTPAGNSSTLLLDRNKPTAISRLLGRTEDSVTGDGSDGSAIRRLLRRVNKAWENGSLWVAFVIGLAFGGVEPDVGLCLIAIIVASGAGIGAQVIAAIVFVVTLLAIIEIALISYLATPPKTQTVVQRLHYWALTHRRKILVAMCTVAGVSLVANGVYNM